LVLRVPFTLSAVEGHPSRVLRRVRVFLLSDFPASHASAPRFRRCVVHQGLQSLSLCSAALYGRHATPGAPTAPPASSLAQPFLFRRVPHARFLSVGSSLITIFRDRQLTFPSKSENPGPPGARSCYRCLFLVARVKLPSAGNAIETAIRSAHESCVSFERGASDVTAVGSLGRKLACARSPVWFFHQSPSSNRYTRTIRIARNS
jgi:hypothetical protein